MLIAQICRSFSAKPARNPMIKFRKGGIAKKSAPPQPQPSGGRGQAPAPVKAQKSTSSSSYVYEIQNMPARLRRKELSKEECDIINSGGAR